MYCCNYWSYWRNFSWYRLNCWSYWRNFFRYRRNYPISSIPTQSSPQKTQTFAKAMGCQIKILTLCVDMGIVATFFDIGATLGRIGATSRVIVSTLGRIVATSSIIVATIQFPPNSHSIFFPQKTQPFAKAMGCQIKILTLCVDRVLSQLSLILSQLLLVLSQLLVVSSQLLVVLAQLLPLSSQLSNFLLIPTRSSSHKNAALRESDGLPN